MSKARSKDGQRGKRPPPSRVVVQIAFSFDEEDNDTASTVECNRSEPSGAATPAEARPKGRRGKWYSLYDKVYAPANLLRAWVRVKANRGAPGCDGQTVAQFGRNAEANLAQLHQELREHSYRPRPVRRVNIPKASGGIRPLGIPTVRDRVVQQAVAQVLTPIFEAVFYRHSYGFRPERSCHDALRTVDAALRHGREFIVDADITKFFDNVDHELLLDAVHQEVTDGSVLKLIRMFLTSGALTQEGTLEETPIGTPQGGPLSPLLANIYLHPFDTAMQEAGFGLVRYADDFVIMSKDRQRAEEALQAATKALHGLKLQLHPEKTRIATIDEGFSFLGYRYIRTTSQKKGTHVQKVISRKSLLTFHRSVNARTRRHAGQKRRKAIRCTVKRLKRNPRIQAMIRDLNTFLRGWYEYFKDVRTTWDKYMDGLDGYVRRRMRNVISGRCARGRWHQLLDNKLFAQLGLVSLAELEVQNYASLQASPNSG